jgi:hypothetical protein
MAEGSMSLCWHAISRRLGGVALLAASSAALAADDVRPLAPVARGGLCVTEGAIGQLAGQRLAVDVPKMRAVATAPGAQAIELRFVYHGPTTQMARLGSGEARQQFGLKLHAQDACNLVYAMWRIAPQQRLVVSVKSNPAQHASAQCRNAGYRNVVPRHAAPVPLLRPGEPHRLRADMTATALRVSIDGAVVWDGDLGDRTVPADGPVGIRTDNARLEMEVFADLDATAPRSPCRAHGETED